MIVRLIKRLLIYNLFLITKKNSPSPATTHDTVGNIVIPASLVFFLAEPTSNRCSNYRNHDRAQKPFFSQEGKKWTPST